MFGSAARKNTHRADKLAVIAKYIAFTYGIDRRLDMTLQPGIVNIYIGASAHGIDTRASRGIRHTGDLVGHNNTAAAIRYQDGSGGIGRGDHGHVSVFLFIRSNRRIVRRKFRMHHIIIIGVHFAAVIIGISDSPAQSSRTIAKHCFR